MKHVRTAGSENFCSSRGFVHNVKGISEEVFGKCQRETKHVSPPGFMLHFGRICVTYGTD
jgi:hypothetical protein